MSITQTGAETSAPGPVRASGFRRGLLATLIALLLLATALFAWLAADRLSNRQSDLQSEREQAMSAASQFMLRLGTSDPSMLDAQGTMPEYRRLIGEVVTTKLRTKFEGADFQAAENLAKQAGMSQRSEVYATGVESIDSDSATVLVAGRVQYTYRGEGGGAQEPVAFRYIVTVLKVDGKWLVDDYARAGGDQ